MYVAWAHGVIRWRWLILIGTLILVALDGSGMWRLSFSSNYRVFFSSGNPQFVAFEKMQNVYSRSDNVLFVLRHREKDAFSDEMLGIVDRLTEAGWKLPYSTRVDSITNFQHTWANGDDLTVEDLVPDPSAMTDALRGRVREIALAEPLLVDRLVSPDGRTTGVNVTIRLPGQSPDELRGLAAEVRRLGDGIRAEHPEVDVALTGIIMLNNAFQEISRTDAATIVPLMYVGLLLAMLFFLRSVAGTIGAVLVVAFAAASALGAAGWLGMKLNPLSISAPTVILTVAIADSVHILMSLFAEMRRGLGKKEALVESLRLNMQPVFLTSLTTAIGFLSLNSSDVPPVRELGNIAAGGVFAAWLLSVAFLPALLAVLPIRSGRVSRELGMHALAGLVVRYRRTLLWAATAVVLVLGAMIPRIELNDRFVQWFDPEIEFRHDTEYAMKHLTGLYQIQVSLGAGEPSGIARPEYLRELDRFVEWAGRQPGVVHVDSIVPIMKRLNRNLHGDDPAWHRLPDERELAAQYLLLYEMSLPYGLDLNTQIDVDKSATRVTITTEDLSTREFRALHARLHRWLREEARGLPVDIEGTGPSVMFSFISERNIRSMLGGTLVAFVLISLSLIVALRSLKIGLVSLIPNLIPAVIGFGIWSILVGEVGMASASVVALSFGLIVDNTIHFLSKYLRGRRERGLPSREAIRYAFGSVGTALFGSTLILVAGFSILALSSFLQNAQMGLLTAITIFAALVCDFLLLPPLLIALDGEETSAEIRRSQVA